MLTHAENDLLCRVEGDAPMGQLMRRHWIPACLIRGGRRARRRAGARAPAGRRPGGLSRYRRPRRACWTSIARTAARRWRSAATRSAACAASTTAGRWTSTATSSTCRRSREEQLLRTRSSTRRIPAARRGGFVWVWMGPPEQMREFEPPAWAPSPSIRPSVVKIHVGCNWAQVLEGAIDSAHSSSLHSTDMVPARSRQCRRNVQGMAAALDRQGAAPAGAGRPISAFATSRSAVRSRTRATHDYLRITLFVAPFTVLIPPNDRYSLVDPQHSAGRHQHDVLLHRVERGRGHRAGSVARVLRRAGRCRSRRATSAASAPARTTTCRIARR